LARHCKITFASFLTIMHKPMVLILTLQGSAPACAQLETADSADGGFDRLVFTVYVAPSRVILC
ncbi:hypothetical protein, partial [Serratia marcescens]|uniref:hypothetical protein n=1 Tax=Serratia marcescens TaxID=615 RepID=UPI00195429C5